MKKIFVLLALCAMAAAGNIIMAGEVVPDSLSTTNVSGKYIFIPDSLENDVLKLVMGHSTVVDDAASPDLSKKTLWKGDTVDMVLKSRKLGRFDRGLINHLYIPKHQWAFGLTASYGEFTTDDLGLMDLMSDIDIRAHAFSIRPSVSYFIKNNLSLGLRLGYTSMKGNIDSFKIDISDDMNFSLNDIMYRNESYTAALTLQQYVGLSARGRFGIFNEVELAFSSGNSDFQRPYNGDLRTTHTTYMEAALNFSPGVCVFIMDNVSFNISFGVFGFHLKNEHQKENGEDLGNRVTSGANFRFNIFNINFGIGIHI